MIEPEIERSNSSRPVTDYAGTISLRPATAADQTFLLGVYAGTRDDLGLANLADSQRQLLIEMQFSARQNQYRFAYPDANTSIIVENDKAIGSMIVNRGAEDIRLVDIALLPERRDHGIGTYLLRMLLQEGCVEAKAVRLRVAATNRALAFYERLGFAKIKDGGGYISMEWRAPASSPELAGQSKDAVTAEHPRTERL